MPAPVWPPWSRLFCSRLALFFLPLIQPLQGLTYAYGPALIAVGVLMLGSLGKIPFDDLTEAVPAFVTIVMMIFTYNIANGLTAGLIVYPVIKLLTGRWRDLNARLDRAGAGVFGLLRVWVAALRGRDEG